ncbi:MAG: hypothetical protein EOP21_04730, partial [Hyphomicrobiales bacterium]
ILGNLKEPKEAATWHTKALEYRRYWQKDFQDMAKPDVDRLPARGLYQGTIWQYRWNVPFDVRGLQELMGGEATFRQQLDTFFGGDYYNHANETDLQAPTLYNATRQPWQSQALVHHLAVDTVVQHYFNDNSRGIEVVVGHGEVGPARLAQPVSGETREHAATHDHDHHRQSGKCQALRVISQHIYHFWSN